MATLVTGAAGTIGISLVKALLAKEQKKGQDKSEEKEKVIGLDNFITGSHKNLEKLRSDDNFTFLEMALEDPQLAEKLKDFKIAKIFHLACPTGVPNLEILSEEMLSASSRGTKNILKLALQKKACFVYSSSSEVYGDPLISPQAESYTGNVDPVGIRSPYEEGKRFSEALTMTFVKKHNLDAKIVRIFNTFGPDFYEHDLRVIPHFLTQAWKNKDLVVQGDGKQRRTFLYVDDLINGLFLIMDQGLRGEVYNLGSDLEMSILELAQLIVKMTKSKSKIVFSERPEHDPTMRKPALGKINKLGWKQTISLEAGLKKILDLRT